MCHSVYFDPSWAHSHCCVILINQVVCWICGWVITPWSTGSFSWLPNASPVCTLFFVFIWFRLTIHSRRFTICLPIHRSRLANTKYWKKKKTHCIRCLFSNTSFAQFRWNIIAKITVGILNVVKQCDCCIIVLRIVTCSTCAIYFFWPFGRNFEIF